MSVQEERHVEDGEELENDRRIEQCRVADRERLEADLDVERELVVEERAQQQNKRDAHQANHPLLAVGDCTELGRDDCYRLPRPQRCCGLARPHEERVWSIFGGQVWQR